MPEERNRRAPSWRMKLVFVLGALVAAFLLAEIGLRIAGVSRGLMRQPDTQFGWSLRPGAAEWCTKETPQYVTINSSGFRDVERALVKPPGTYRIAVLGDSYTQAVEVALVDTYCQQLERLLNASAADGRKFEVLSFGVISYGNAQQLLVLREKVFAFAPDMVLTAVFLGNDLTDNLRALDNAGESQLRPYYCLVDGKLQLDDSFRETEMFKRSLFWNRGLGGWLYLNSRVFQLANSARKALRERSRTDENAAYLKMTQKVFAPPQDKDWEESWRVTDALLREMNAECKKRNIPFGVITMNMPEQAHPDRGVREKLGEELGVKDLLYPDRRVASIGAAGGFPVLLLAPVFQRVADETGQYLHGFPTSQMGTGHWNEKGHQLAAETIYAWLPAADAKRLGELPQRPAAK